MSVNHRLALRKRLSSLLFRRYSETLDRMNHNPSFIAFAEQHADLLTVSDKLQLHAYLHSQFIGQSPIDYLEFGVFRGESIRRWSEMNTSPDSRFFGFDSFQGLPEQWQVSSPRGHFSTDGVLPSIDDPRVHFVKGWFQDTVPQFVREYTPKNRMVMHNDSDLYSSTLLCLTQFNNAIQPGTILIFDEFGDLLHEFRAFMDYIHAYGRRYKALVATPDLWTLAVLFE